MPAIRRMRRRDTAPPERAASSGRTVFSMISRISDGTPGSTTICRSPFEAQKPGAVPRGFSSTRAPTMKSACF